MTIEQALSAFQIIFTGGVGFYVAYSSRAAKRAEEDNRQKQIEMEMTISVLKRNQEDYDRIKAEIKELRHDMDSLRRHNALLIAQVMALGHVPVAMPGEK